MNHTNTMPPTSVYVFQYDNVLNIRLSFVEIQGVIRECADVNYEFDQYLTDRESIAMDNQFCVGAYIPEADHACERDLILLEFVFECNEPVSLMVCNGASNECCFIHKKSRPTFWKEAMEHMTETVNCFEDDCNIRVLHRKEAHYKSMEIAYAESNGDITDMMTFTFIHNIV